MNLRLEEIPAAKYSEQILPLTEPLWANGRSLETYVAQTEELANSPYGRRAYRTLALTDGSSRILASFKRYEREARAGRNRLRAIGIGAVFTPEPERGKGYASAMLGLALDQARKGGFDFAYLFSDIHPQFYKDLGFVELPSRSLSVRADTLNGTRIKTETMTEGDWPGVRRCFDAMEEARPFALLRAPMLWNWIRMRMRHCSEHAKGQPVHLVVRRSKSIVAYVIGQREPKHDAFVLDEVAYADESAAKLVPALLRSGAGDLRRIVGWLPPAPVRALLPRGSVRRRSDAIWMAAPLSAGGTAFIEAANTSGNADGVWSLDHI